MGHKKYTGFKDVDNKKIYVGDKVDVGMTEMFFGKRGEPVTDAYSGIVTDNGEKEDNFRITRREKGCILEGSLAYECTEKKDNIKKLNNIN